MELVVMLNQSGEEPVECPLCMEPLEVDDLTFFPCTCGYQICRFCWHRIRTDENGLCPACRKAYPENPADFRPLSREEVAHLKAQKKQKDQQRKQKIMENRKHLANVRVVQHNLVFVVGLPSRLADAEVLKKHEYFGKFGKIQKVVINQSTSYAGSQGPSASAYVTFQRADDALQAIQAVNNIMVDGRPIRSSLGTTKYCSHFLKNQMCPKPDCMYLHELGDTEASFTKEEMQQGKHQEYEKKLHEQLLSVSRERKLVSSVAVTSSTANSQNMTGTTTSCPVCVNSNAKELWPTRNTGYTTFGHYNEANMSSIGISKGDCSHRRHKVHCQLSNLETTQTLEEETKKKEECRSRTTQDEQKSKQIPNLPNRKSHLEHVSDKPSLNEHMQKAAKNMDLEIFESEDHLQSRKHVGAKLGSNGEKHLCSGRERFVTDQRAPSSNSANKIVTGKATNRQSVLPPEDWQANSHLAGSTHSTEWGYSSSCTQPENQVVADSAQLHTVTKNGMDDCDVTSHNQNSSYGEENLYKPQARSEVVENNVDGHTGIRSQDNAGVTSIVCIQDSTKPPLTSNMRGVHHPHSFIHYDPAILMINQFSGGKNGSQLLFMNGQPSQTTRRFLEDVQIAQEQKEWQLRQLQSHSDHGSAEILDVKSEFDVGQCDTRMTVESKEESNMNRIQNNDSEENVKGIHPPGFLYHQQKNKGADVKYIDSIINPFMSSVQITGNKRPVDDELGFDPFHETQKALAEMMEKESLMQHGLHNQHNAFSCVPEHVNLKQQHVVDKCHPVDLFKNQQQCILPQQNHRLPSNVRNCSKLLDGFGLNRGMSAETSIPRRIQLPPPGFSSMSNHTQAYSILHSQSDAGL